MTKSWRVQVKKHKKIEVLKKLGKPTICTERAVLVTQAYKEFEKEQAVVKRAKVFEKLLCNMSIHIQEDELIVGNLASEPFAVPIYPEYSWEWIIDQMEDFEKREGDRFYISQEKKEALRSLLPWWKGRSVDERALVLMPDEVKKARDAMLISLENSLTGAIGHYVPNYERILQEGFNGVKAEIEERMAKLDPTQPRDFEKRLFYEASLRCCDAMVRFSNRYSELAGEMAEKAGSQKRKKELLRIAEICARVPGNPAGSFYEALQSLWFAHLANYIFHNGLAVTIGRFDQYMYPFYEEDIKNGKISREEAKQLLESLWLKFNEIIKLYNNLAARLYSGFPITQAPQLGGLTVEGEDATNDLSELVLEVEASVSLPQPDVAVLYHEKMSHDFLVKACRMLPLAMKPKFFNVPVGTQHLLRLGVSSEDSKNYAFVGCVESTAPGKTWGWHNSGLINLAKCLELALNNGTDPATREKLGPETGEPRNFGRFDDVKRAFDKQVAHAIKMLVIALHSIEIAHKELVPLPYQSMLVDDCIEKGLDLHSGGARYNFTGIQAVGLATVADSLMAIKTLVFEKKSLTMEKLLLSLETNYKGMEELRQMLTNKMPKYGNDIDQVDHIAREVLQNYCSKVRRYRNRRGGPYTPGAFSISAHVALGASVLATPDGRKAGEPLSDACSPSQGMCKKGPTATYKSLAKLDHLAVTNGTLLNMKFDVLSFRSDDSVRKFADMLRAYMDMGGFHAQFNIVDPVLLRDAQKNPEKYPDLYVRVAAYVALFAQLGKEVQNEVISRSTMEVR
jgi:formate C-acetyltransferase